MGTLVGAVTAALRKRIRILSFALSNRANPLLPLLHHTILNPLIDIHHADLSLTLAQHKALIQLRPDRGLLIVYTQPYR